MGAVALLLLAGRGGSHHRLHGGGVATDGNGGGGGGGDGRGSSGSRSSGGGSGEEGLGTEASLNLDGVHAVSNRPLHAIVDLAELGRVGARLNQSLNDKVSIRVLAAEGNVRGIEDELVEDDLADGGDVGELADSLLKHVRSELIAREADALADEGR